MKKLILSLFMVAICGLAHAGNAVETPKVEICTTESTVLAEDVECGSYIIPICDDGVEVGYTRMQVCARRLSSFLSSFNC